MSNASGNASPACSESSFGLLAEFMDDQASQRSSSAAKKRKIANFKFEFSLSILIMLMKTHGGDRGGRVTKFLISFAIRAIQEVIGGGSQCEAVESDRILPGELFIHFNLDHYQISSFPMPDSIQRKLIATKRYFVYAQSARLAIWQL
ncbi:hypothetical protein T01_3492 [Trichinella spiralis]|uniref:Uncharacterized protein n=1 Tax=Trichinella spiralis TaxID=6334 RepID=A0A0V1AY73_TRISP|nr:hypothetical protein T01_3492 [Trichinella spiralis]